METLVKFVGYYTKEAVTKRTEYLNPPSTNGFSIYKTI